MSKKKTYWYCPTDSMGQRTGETRRIEVPENEIENRLGCEFWRGIFLYSSDAEAIRAALS